MSRRDNRERISQGEANWILDAICRETKMIRLKIVERRNERICEKFTTNKICLKLNVNTDCWSGYKDLSGVVLIILR